MTREEAIAVFQDVAGRLESFDALGLPPVYEAWGVLFPGQDMPSYYDDEFGADALDLGAAVRMGAAA